jgi:ATP-binding cassette subfamily F protein uup
MAYITLRDVQLAFGGPALLDGANFNLERGERVCLIGRNGEGKSTLLKLIEGSLLPDHGEVLVQNGLTISMLPKMYQWIQVKLPTSWPMAQVKQLKF